MIGIGERAAIRLRVLLAIPLLLWSCASAAIRVQDDAGATVVLARPAQRVVSLAPHATELLFAAGGGERIVGAVEYSDYPPAARSIPRVGDNRQIDIERVLALKPDLLVVWLYDESVQQIEQLRRLGIPLFYSDPRRLEDIPGSLLRMGQLLGTEPEAKLAASSITNRIEMLARRYRDRPPVRVFYQVWDRPLYTLNGRHIVNDAIRLCGGENIFAHLATTAPSLTQEAVMQEDPEAIVSGDRQDRTDSGVDMWRPYRTMLAVRRGNLFAISGDLMHRSGPRIVDGAAQLCERLEEARKRRGSKQ